MPGQAAVSGITAGPSAVELDVFPGNLRLHPQVLDRGRHFRAGDLATAQGQVAVDLGRQQAAGQAPAAVEATGQGLDLTHKRPSHTEIEAAETEITGQGLVLRQGIDLRLEHQFAKLATAKIQHRVDPPRGQVAGQLEGLVGEIQPFAPFANTQGAAAGIDHDLALGAAGRQVHLQVGIQPALPGEVAGQPLPQAFQGELLEVITQARFGHQPLILAAQAGLSRQPAVAAEVQPAIGKVFEFGRVLQFPVLAAGLYIARDQAPAPVALVEYAVKAQGQLQQRALQVELRLLALEIALPVQSQGAQCRVAGLDTFALEVQLPTLGAVEVGLEAEVLQTVIGKYQLLAVQADLALRRLQRAGEIDPAFDLPAQLRPELAQARQVEVELPGQALLQAAAALDAVIAQANIQGSEGPLFAFTAGLGLEQRRLPTQFALEVDIRLDGKLLVFQFAFAAQRPGQGPGQLRQPVRRVEGAQVQRGVPGDAIGELQLQVAAGLALPRRHFELRQGDLFQVTAERRQQAELARRAVEIGLEVTQVVAVAVMHFTDQGPRLDRRLLDQRVQAMPGEVQPIDLGIGTEALLPIQFSTEFQPLPGIGGQVQRGDLRALRIDPTLQVQVDGALLGRQHGLALELVTVFQVAAAGELQLIE